MNNFISNILSLKIKKFLFLCIIIFPALSQSATPEISCDQTADIDQFKASLTSYANELNIQNIDQLNKYLDGQVIEETSTKVSIRSSLIPAKKYVELSKAYGVNIAKHDYYELFNSPSFMLNYKLIF